MWNICCRDVGTPVSPSQHPRIQVLARSLAILDESLVVVFFSVCPCRCRSKLPKMLSYRFLLQSSFFPCVLTARLGPPPSHFWGFEVTHNYTHHTRYDSSGRRIGLSQRQLPMRNIVERNYAIILLEGKMCFPIDFLWYTRVNKNPSTWNFLSPKPEVTCGTVAIIIWVVLLTPYLRIRAVSLSSIHYNQSHRVYINRRRQYVCLIWN